jgi:hypothetical protein
VQLTGLPCSGLLWGPESDAPKEQTGMVLGFAWASALEKQLEIAWDPLWDPLLEVPWGDEWVHVMVYAWGARLAYSSAAMMAKTSGWL